MIPSTNHRVLLVDDNPAIHEDFTKILHGRQKRNQTLDNLEAAIFEEKPLEQATSFVLDSALQGEEALAKVIAAQAEGQPYAMAFVDVRMPPGWDGVETIEQLWKIDPALQVVICTAYSDYSWDKMTARLGINDNLLILKKPFDHMEVLQLAHALTRKWTVTQQAQLKLTTLEKMVTTRTTELQATNLELRASEQRFSRAFRASPIPFAMQASADSRFVDANDAFLKMTGIERATLIGRTPGELCLALDREDRIKTALAAGKSVRNLEIQFTNQLGEVRQTVACAERIMLSEEPHILLMVQDITHRVQLENQLRQAQKMEAVGQLAAGIAHDFNNLLTVIQGHTSLQLTSGALSSDTTDSLRQISVAAERAADLTRQLLTFSRRQMTRPRVLQLNGVIENLTSMLRRFISEAVEFSCTLGADLPSIWADQTSLEQVVMNLTLNARDALPNGGKIQIATALVQRTPLPDGPTSDYVCLSVTDNGVGMDDETRNHIFEPFFTTKDVNKGTGMGLATVYGIVQQHDGWVEVVTRPGGGSAFSIFLPVTERIAETGELPTFLPDAQGGAHTILIVEDDDAVRGLVKEILLSHDYDVIEADNPERALEVFREHGQNIELLLTDLMMPGGCNGLELAQLLLSLKPDLKVIYTSGYSSELFTSNIQLEEGTNYLPKPYLSSKLTNMLRHALVTHQSAA